MLAGFVHDVNHPGVTSSFLLRASLNHLSDKSFLRSSSNSSFTSDNDSSGSDLKKGAASKAKFGWAQAVAKVKGLVAFVERRWTRSWSTRKFVRRRRPRSGTSSSGGLQGRLLQPGGPTLDENYE